MPPVDPTPLTDAAERLADRLRSLPQSALRRGAAEAGLALARELSVRAQRLESGPSGEPRIMPDAGIFAVGDQLSVATQDLALALAKAPAAQAAPTLTESLALTRKAVRSI